MLVGKVLRSTHSLYYSVGGKENVDVKIRKDEIVECHADSRGRVTLGAKYAGENVQVAILDVCERDVENQN